ncbi:HesB/YadR/YfhF family protein [Brevibacillus daliensis]|uniref:HesB/YadR/YfhF family protein n=1 Tax=Brevibacillus daliensis TaxID=2892995 RepID=UPI001E58584E|nr:HesB/YadR/YfhF family protein [Brevibacillus daliensis]
MKITITPQALSWFKKDWGFAHGDFVRFFVRYGGGTSLHTSYSMGVMKADPKEIAVSVLADDITFFFEQDDLWFVEGKNMKVDFDAEKEEITFHFD